MYMDYGGHFFYNFLSKSILRLVSLFYLYCYDALLSIKFKQYLSSAFLSFVIACICAPNYVSSHTFGVFRLFTSFISIQYNHNWSHKFERVIVITQFSDRNRVLKSIGNVNRLRFNCVTSKSFYQRENFRIADGNWHCDCSNWSYLKRTLKGLTIRSKVSLKIEKLQNKRCKWFEIMRNGSKVFKWSLIWFNRSLRIIGPRIVVNATLKFHSLKSFHWKFIVCSKW